jgi:SNF2-related domain/SNF2 Helicase protein/Helicase conserved C-terminal domain
VTVVHGFLAPGGRIGLWAEATPWATPRAAPDASPEAAAEAPPGAAAEATPGADGAARHPFATTPPVPGELAIVTLTLPSDPHGPLPSPESDPSPRTATRTAAWSVTAVLLEPGTDPEAALEDTLDEAGDGVRAGGSIGFLSDLVATARALVARGRVVPAIVDEDGRPAARWRPVLVGPDEARVEELRRAQPGAAVCAVGGPDLLDHLRATVDALVRTRLGRLTLADAGWLRALTGPAATLTDVQAEEPQGVRHRLARWAATAKPGPVRVCFRLSPDDEDENEALPWLLEFLLQPLADPSVLVPAEHVWAEVAGPLTRWVDDPQEVLLAGLGTAGRLNPDLDDALRQPRPCEVRLSTAGAYLFLRRAPLLTEAGFGVLVPAQWQKRTELGLTLTVHTRQTTTAVLRDQTANLAAIVDYRWGLALGGDALSEADLIELARAKVPLVRLRGRWVFLDEDRLAKGLSFLERGGEGQMTAGEAMRLMRLIPDGDQPLPVTEVDGTGWLADLLSGRAPEELEPVEPPVTLATQLRPYQRRGLSWLAFLDRLGIGALLADDMGLGKTVQLLALEARSREAGPRPPTLIVCPLSILGNWQREIRRFTPHLTVSVYHGSAREIGDSDLVLTTYQVAARDVDALAAQEWDRVVLDEAQQVKNAATGTARALRRVQARHRVALTGTPVENRLADLWSIMDFLNPDLLGPASIFRARYSVPVERFGDEEAAARLRRVIRPLVLRRRKTDEAVIADLPDKLERTQWCNLTTEQTSLYRAVVDELFVKMRERRPGNRHKGLVLSAMTKLKQVCNHPAQLLGDGSPIPHRSGKVARLEEILATALAEGDQALVFTQFARLGTLLQPHLRDRLGTEVAFLHGGTGKGARDRMVERFQNRDGPRVLVLSLKAGGTGLNLTAANHVVHVDRWWNPATEAQATDRAFRIGQTRDVQVHTLVCLGTIEERIDAMIAEKRTLAEMAVGSDEEWLAGLSTSDLYRLVALSGDAADD